MGKRRLHNLGSIGTPVGRFLAMPGTRNAGTWLRSRCPLAFRWSHWPCLLHPSGVWRRRSDAALAIEMSRRLRAFLLEYTYPGNIRELRNIVYRLSCLAGQMADIEHLPADIRPAAQAKLASDPASGDEGQSLSGDALSEAKRAASDLAEREFLERGLQEAGGVVVEMAKRCNMNRSHLQVLLKKHGIRSKEFRAASRADKAI